MALSPFVRPQQKGWILNASSVPRNLCRLGQAAEPPEPPVALGTSGVGLSCVNVGGDSQDSTHASPDPKYHLFPLMLQGHGLALLLALASLPIHAHRANYCSFNLTDSITQFL